MDIAGGLRKLFSMKESRTARSIVQFYSGGQAVWTPADYGSLAANGYQANVYVFSCVNLIARAIGGLDWGVFKYDRFGRRVELDAHPLVAILRKPNPGMGMGRFFESVAAFLMLSGNTYIESVGPDNSPVPKELWLLRPDRMKIIAGNAQKMIRSYEYTVSGSRTVIESEAILHLKLFNPLDDWYGMSPLQAASRSMDQNNFSKEWNMSLLQNSGRPSGAFMADTRLPDPQYKILKDQVDVSYSESPNSRIGFRNAGRPLLLEGVKWQEMSISPKDMDWLEGGRRSALEIAIAFGVPPKLMGDTATDSYASNREARKGFYEETVLPLADWIQGELNSWLVGRYDDSSISIAYDKDDIEALSEDRDSLWKRVTAAPFLTINEKRVAVGYEERPDGDIYGATASYQQYQPITEDQPTTQAKLPAPRKFNSLDIKLKCSPPRGYETKAVAGDRHRQYLADAKKKQDAWLLPITAQIEAEFAAEAGEAAALLERGGDPIKAIKPDKWNGIISGIFLSVGKDFAESAAAGDGMETPPGDWWMEYVAEYVQTTAGAKIRQITDTSERVLKEILERGVREGTPIAEIAAEIQSNAFDLAQRAEMIARTEIHNACQAGTRAFAEMGSLKTHTWLCANDDLSRLWHKDAHWQTVPVDEPFIVMGEELMFPGDGSKASAENIINCRCVEIYGEPLPIKEPENNDGGD